MNIYAAGAVALRVDSMEALTIMRPTNHHGGNPVLSAVGSKERKALLKREARWRAAGDWGSWQKLERQQFAAILGGRTGWVTEVTSVYRNKVFSVLERHDATGIIHAGIASLSGIRPTWYEMQRIKDEVFGEGSTAVEVYPPKRDIVDGSDMFHLWILPKELPFGLRKLEKSRHADEAAWLFDRLDTDDHG